MRSLDPAFLRLGRFDYLIPIGPPDATARAAIWQRYLGRAAEAVDVTRLVEATEMFSPADIEFAARKGAQAAFEVEVVHRKGEPATTEDYLAAVHDIRPTLTDQIRFLSSLPDGPAPVVAHPGSLDPPTCGIAGQNRGAMGRAAVGEQRWTISRRSPTSLALAVHYGELHGGPPRGQGAEATSARAPRRTP